MHGFVEDIRALYSRMRISVVPLRWGAGVKGKVNTAMKHGVPVVCTTVAQEGMYLEDGENAMVTDDTSAFADKIYQVYTNEDRWNRIVQGGYRNIKTHFSVSNAAHGMATALEHVIHKHRPLQSRLRESTTGLSLHQQCRD